jgi:hypothetical protein
VYQDVGKEKRKAKGEVSFSWINQLTGSRKFGRSYNDAAVDVLKVMRMQLQEIQKEGYNFDQKHLKDAKGWRTTGPSCSICKNQSTFGSLLTNYRVNE